ncbi:MAG: Holliday junction branch migration DNA helicase RuvB [Acidobacteriota bacterium]
MHEDILERQAHEGERRLEVALRPRTLAEYCGQRAVVDNLQVFIAAARQREEALDHVLVAGPPGLGKTTLAYIIAHEMGASIQATSGPAIERAGDLAAILTHLQSRDVLFIDEIHRLSPTLEEILYSAMEDFQLDLVVGQGPTARTVKIDLPRFTLVGASTRVGMLTSPLRERFGIVHHLEYYLEQDLSRILERSARLLDVELEDGAAAEVARRSRGTPRIANRLLRRIRDFTQVEGLERIGAAAARAALERLRVDERGLDEVDRRLLQAIGEKFGGGPVGLNTLSAAIGEEKDTIEEFIEPYLVQIGFVDRTPRGRCVTPRALRHLGLDSKTPPSPRQRRLID